MFSTTPLHTTTPFGCGSNFIVIPDDSDTETESDITMAQETQELNISRRDRDPTGGTRDRFLGSRDTVSRNSADAAAAVAQRDEMRRGRALGSEYSWHQQTFKLAVAEQLPKASGLLLLGRTPSGSDYAKDMDEEDAATLISDSSSYCARPTRMQMIHRPIPALFQDEERDTEDLPDAENDADQNTEGPQMLLSPAVLVRDDSREESSKPLTRKSDGHQRDGLMRGNEQQQQQQQNVGSNQLQTDTTEGRITFSPPGKYYDLSTGEQDWLEMEPENPADTCGSCMGYSLLDFLVPAATYSTSRRRGQRSRTSKHRLPRSTLPLNTVEETADEGSADFFNGACSPRVAPTRRKTELDSPTRRKTELDSTTPRLKHKKDPAGDYEDPVGTYSSLVY
jgi:hypothetical protein